MKNNRRTILGAILLLMSLFLLGLSGCASERVDEEAYQTIDAQLDILDLPQPEEKILAYRFSEGLSICWRYGKQGFINKEGQVVIEPNFDAVLWFSEGLAPVCRNGLWGFIDKTGAMLIDCQFQEAYQFSGGMAPVFDGERWFLIDRSGQPVAFDYSHTGQQEAMLFREGLATYRIENPASEGDWDKQLYGYVDTRGSVVIPAQYTRAQPFSDGYALVEKDSKTYLIDQEGVRAFPEMEPRGGFTEFRDGMALWLLDDGSSTGQYCLCNTKGEVVFRFPKEQGEPSSYAEGLIIFRNREGKYGAMDRQGTVVIPPVLSLVVSSMGGVLESYHGGQVPFYIRNPLWTGE